MYDVITDAAEDRAANLAEPARTHHDVAGLLACRHADDELAGLLEVRDEFAAQLQYQCRRHRHHIARTRSTKHRDTSSATGQTHRYSSQSIIRSYIIYIKCCNINQISELRTHW